MKTKTNMLATNKKVIKNLQATKSTASTTTTTIHSSSHRRRPAAAMSLLFIFILVILINISCVDCLYQQQQLPHHTYHGDSSKGLVNLEAKVGSHVVFNCRIDFPYDYDIPYIIHWSKDVSKVRFLKIVMWNEWTLRDR